VPFALGNAIRPCDACRFSDSVPATTSTGDDHPFAEQSGHRAPERSATDSHFAANLGLRGEHASPRAIVNAPPQAFRSLIGQREINRNGAVRFMTDFHGGRTGAGFTVPLELGGYQSERLTSSLRFGLRDVQTLYISLALLEIDAGFMDGNSERGQIGFLRSGLRH
jgi:hypothetical protein